MLKDRRLLITGVLTRQSIAYAVAEQAQRAGAEVVLTSFGRARAITERAAKQLPRVPDVLELDVNEPDHFVALADELRARWGGLDGAVHAIANAPPDALGASFIETPVESATSAFATSAYSYKALSVALLPLLERDQGPWGSVVGLDFDASVAWPGYNWMGVAKAALESINRYLAQELGPRGVRANLVAAGPLETPARSGIPGARSLNEQWNANAPLGWNVRDTAPVGRAVCFLLSEWADAVTGEILHADGGYHAVAPMSTGDAT